MEPVQGTRISKYWTKKSVPALQDSRDQEVPSPGTLLKLMILAVNRAKGGGGEEKHETKMNRHRAAQKKTYRGPYGWRNQAEVLTKSVK